MRDENTKIKNKLKAMKVNSSTKEATSHYEEFTQFKERVNLEIVHLNKSLSEKSKRIERLSSVDSSIGRSEESDANHAIHIEKESKQYKRRRQANIKPIKNNRIDISYDSESEDHNLK